MLFTILSILMLPFVTLCFPKEFHRSIHTFASPYSLLQEVKYNDPNSTLKFQHFTWAPPRPGDLRSPCPCMNTLANHGFLPRDGRNITLAVLQKALKDGMNIGAETALEGFKRGLPANPTPNATWLNLDMLHKHNIIEHDGSLSRRDSVFDPTNSFDEDTFNNLLKYFGNATEITIASTANARARHALDMSRLNANFSITSAQVPVIVGENAMMLAIWGHPDNPVANRSFYEYFFRNERLPVEIGWTPSKVEIGPTLQQIVVDLLNQTIEGVPLTFGE